MTLGPSCSGFIICGYGVARETLELLDLIKSRCDHSRIKKTVMVKGWFFKHLTRHLVRGQDGFDSCASWF